MRAAGAGRGTGATGPSVIVPDLEPAAFGYVDTPLRKPPRPIKVEDAEAAAAVRVAQPGPKVGERRALEDGGLGFVDTPLRKTIRSTIKPEPGLVPEPAQLEPGRGSEPAQQEAGPGAEPAQLVAGRGSEPAPKKRRAKKKKCADDRGEPKGGDIGGWGRGATGASVTVRDLEPAGLGFAT